MNHRPLRRERASASHPSWFASHRGHFFTAGIVVAVASAGTITAWHFVSPPLPGKLSSVRLDLPDHAPSSSHSADVPSETGTPEATAFLDPGTAGNLAFSAGDFQAALGYYRDAVAQHPTDAESLSNMGQVLVRLDRREEAVPLFERAVQLNPDRWAYHFNLAHALGELGDWARAVEEYQQAARLFPDDYATRYNLGMALHKHGDDAAAVIEYLKAIALRPDDPTFHLSLGISYERQRQSAEAAAAYQRYLDLAPAAPNADQVRTRIVQLASEARRQSSQPPPEMLRQ